MLQADQEKILALLASWPFHYKPAAKRGNFSVEKVLSVTNVQHYKHNVSNIASTSVTFNWVMYAQTCRPTHEVTGLSGLITQNLLLLTCHS